MHGTVAVQARATVAEMGRRLGAALVLLVGASLATGCRPSTVTLTFAPQVGDRYTYRYEVDATVTRSLDGAAPAVSDLHTTIEAEQEVLEVSPGGVRAAVTLRRDGEAPRSTEVRLDRAGALQGVDLIEGQPAGVFGLRDLDGVLPTVALPSRALAPGDRWSLDGASLAGEARLARLGVIDGEDVAVIVTRTSEPIEDTVPTGTTTAALQGQLRARATTAYDLRDGSLRRSTSRARGQVQVRIAPPPGVDSAAASGTITYDIRVRVTRLG